jgi:hypothetical protein
MPAEQLPDDDTPGTPDDPLARRLSLRIDYVIVFTRLAGGSDRRLLAASPLLMLSQMAPLPGYVWVFMGSELADIVEPGPVLEAFGDRAPTRAA